MFLWRNFHFFWKRGPQLIRCIYFSILGLVINPGPKSVSIAKHSKRNALTLGTCDLRTRSTTMMMMMTMIMIMICCCDSRTGFLDDLLKKAWTNNLKARYIEILGITVSICSKNIVRIHTLGYKRKEKINLTGIRRIFNLLGGTLNIGQGGPN